MLYRLSCLLDRMLIPKEPLLNGVKEKVYKKYLGAILCLHRVSKLDSSRMRLNENLKVTPRYLESLIVDYISNGVDIISLKDIASRLSEKSNRPFICFTFDDGYKDNYINAYPIFRKYNVPFTICLSSSFPEQNAIIWWEILESLISNNDRIILGNGSQYVCQTDVQKEQAFMDIRKEIFKIPPQSFSENILQLFSEYDIDLYEPVRKEALSWNEINELLDSGLCSFGNHTNSHCSVIDLSENQIKADISCCNQLFYKHTGCQFSYFCYPYGRFNEKTQRIVKECFDFQSVLTLTNDYIRRDSDLFALPRISLERKDL